MSSKVSRCVWSILLGLALLSSMILVLGATPAGRIGINLVLVDQAPAPNVFTASLDTVVQATYDQMLDPATVTSRTFAVHAMQTGWLTESLAVQGDTILLTPTMPFHPGELVQVSATTGTLSMEGAGAIAPAVWQFWTEADGRAALFQDSGQRLRNDDNRGLAIGDLDGDGDIDAFVGDFGGESQVYLNDGTGAFTYSGQNIGTSSTTGIALGDLDGDGDLDAFESKGGGSANRVWFNDGAGTFIDSGQSLGASYSFFTALGDLDGDGDLDAFVPNGRQFSGGVAQPNKVYLNDGSGIFTDSGQALGFLHSVSVALGDLDGDGDLDAFVANGGYFPEGNKVWLNDGTGVFVDSGMSLGGGESLIVALGDLDGDGDLDAYVTNLNEPGGGEPDEVWFNIGSGLFKLGGTVSDVASAGVALGDLDGDQDLDAFVCQIDGSTVWLNDGSGSFARTGQTLNECLVPALGDLDGDADLDAFLALGEDITAPNQVWFNEPVRELYLPLVTIGK